MGGGSIPMSAVVFVVPFVGGVVVPGGVTQPANVRAMARTRRERIERWTPSEGKSASDGRWNSAQASNALRAVATSSAAKASLTLPFARPEAASRGQGAG